MTDLAVLEGLAEELPIVAKILGHFEQLTATIETLTDAVGLLSRCDDMRKLEIDTLNQRVDALVKNQRDPKDDGTGYAYLTVTEE